MAGQGAVTNFDEINITPLTDIFLVLLIIMMVVAPSLQSNQQELELPKMQAGQQVEPNPNTVEVNADGELFYRGEPLKLEQLGPQLKEQNAKVLQKLEAAKASGNEEALAAIETPSILLRGDKEARAKVVLPVLAAARDAGFSKVVLAGENKETTTTPATAPLTEAM